MKITKAYVDGLNSTQQEDLKRVDSILYTINSQLISLKAIGMRKQLTQEEFSFINEQLTTCINLVRKYYDEYE